MNHQRQVPSILYACIILFFSGLNHAYSEYLVPELSGIKRNYREMNEFLHEESGAGKSKRHCIKKTASVDVTGENPPSQEICQDQSGEKVYYLELGYYCHRDHISYSGIDFVGIIASNGQEFMSEDWEQGKTLGFTRYRTQEEGKLTITKDMFPLTVSVMLVSTRQPIRILRDRIYNNSENTPLDSLKIWAGEAPLTFRLEESDLFDQNGQLIINGLCINSLVPASTTVLDLIY